MVLFAVTYQLLFDTGGVVNVAGCHRVRPRLIFFTDGRPTDEAMEFGADIQSNVNEVYLHQVYVLQTVVLCVCFSPLFSPSLVTLLTHTEKGSNSKHWFTTSFHQPLLYLVTP